MISDVGTNVTGSDTILASIGLSFGPIGSAVGTTDTLVFDQDAFNKAVQNDPLSVQNALSQFSLTAALAPAAQVRLPARPEAMLAPSPAPTRSPTMASATSPPSFRLRTAAAP